MNYACLVFPFDICHKWVELAEFVLFSVVIWHVILLDSVHKYYETEMIVWPAYLA
jgi:hypothetical protein